MHRTKTRLAARGHRVATALERPGVRATYVLHEHVLSNRASRRQFTGSTELDATRRYALG